VAADKQVSDDLQVAQPTAGVGGLLRETRTLQGRDLATAATTLRIRQPYLLAIEEGRFQDLPGATYAVGFVRGYAEYLGLDQKEIVRRFKQENNEYARRSELVFPSAVSEGSIPTGGLLGFAILAAVVVYGIVYWYSARHGGVAESVPQLPERLATLGQKPPTLTDQAATPPAEPARGAETAPAVQPPMTADGGSAPGPEVKAPAGVREEVVPPSEEEAPAAAPPPVAAEAPPAVEPPKPVDARPAKAGKGKEPPPSASPPAAPAQTEAAPTDVVAPPPAKPEAPPVPVIAPPPVKPEAPAAPTRLQLRATESCWVEIRDAAGHVVMSRLLRKGETYAVPDRPGLVLTAGNAGALTLTVDGKAAGALGRFGVVRHDIPLDPGRLAGGAAGVESAEPAAPSEPSSAPPAKLPE